MLNTSAALSKYKHKYELEGRIFLERYTLPYFFMIQQFLRNDFICSKQLTTKRQVTKATEELKQSQWNTRNYTFFIYSPKVLTQSLATFILGWILTHLAIYVSQCTANQRQQTRKRKRHKTIILRIDDLTEKRKLKHHWEKGITKS